MYKRKAIIFDIDGTLANLDHRLRHILNEPKDWDSFYSDMSQDKPIEPVKVVCKSLLDMQYLADNFGHDAYCYVVFCTGRPEPYRQKTLSWLEKHLLSGTIMQPDIFKLYMRKEGDFRPDAKVKEELLNQIRSDGYEPILAFEDRQRVVDMWRRNGIQCCQVAPGDY